jgi:hypothetical protein
VGGEENRISFDVFKGMMKMFSNNEQFTQTLAMSQSMVGMTQFST